MRPSHKMRNHKFKPLDVCIICLDDQFPRRKMTVEHIIAEALGGTLKFEAVCKQCAEYGNRTFEQPALTTDFLVPRLLLELRKKSSRVLPRAAKNAVVGQSIPDELLEFVSLQLYPKRIIFRELEAPGFLVGIDRPSELNGVKLRIIDLRPYFPDDLYEGNLVTIEAMSNGPFELALAKIAYFYAVATKGLGAFDGSGLRALLRGERDDCRNFVGAPVQKESARNHDLHHLSLRIRPGAFLTVIVHLFASYGVPPYEVVVGRMS